jgi:hypothetical protein
LVTFVSNLLGSPASGETVPMFGRMRTIRCFQFIGFPSEWGGQAAGRSLHRPRVSNLLGSPASGEWSAKAYTFQRWRFQFIGFPSEWGDSVNAALEAAIEEFPIYWVPQRVGSRTGGSGTQRSAGFQFIGFPSEWGVTSIKTRMDREWQGAFASTRQNCYTLYCF